MAGDVLVTTATDLVLDDALSMLMSNGALNLSAGTTLNGAQIIRCRCSPGEMLIWDGSAWGCTDLQSMFDNDSDMAWSDCDDDPTALAKTKTMTVTVS